MSALKDAAEAALREAQSLKVEKPTSYIVIAFDPTTWTLEVATPVNVPPFIKVAFKAITSRFNSRQ